MVPTTAANGDNIDPFLDKIHYSWWYKLDCAIAPTTVTVTVTPDVIGSVTVSNIGIIAYSLLNVALVNPILDSEAGIGSTTSLSTPNLTESVVGGMLLAGWGDGDLAVIPVTPYITTSGTWLTSLAENTVFTPAGVQRKSVTVGGSQVVTSLANTVSPDWGGVSLSLNPEQGETIFFDKAVSVGADGGASGMVPISITPSIAGNFVPITLVPYDDTLPIPTRITLDPIVQSVPMTSPELINTIGTGNPVVFEVGALPLPNCLTFVIQGMGTVTTTISISVTGELDPPAVWPQDIQTNNEVLTISNDGYYQTNSVWSSISSIDVSGLPVDCSLICYILPVDLSAEPDPDRPFTHFAYRGITFPRYWQLQDLQLLETYQRNRFAGYDVHNVYHLPTQMVDVAVEPNTNGLFLCDGLNLYYIDRRTPLPGNLLETGNTVEPAYGINVWYDYEKPGDTTYAYVSPTPYSTANAVTQYRYVVEDPNGNVYVLLPSGILQAYTGGTGYTQGTPTAVSFPLTVIGTWTITLECLGSFNAKTSDTFPYNNMAITPLVTISLASLVPSVQGLAFDAYDKLWLWTGQFAVPVQIHYDAFLFDAESRTIYCTDKYNALVID
jgi:hypothetical protein